LYGAGFNQNQKCHRNNPRHGCHFFLQSLHKPSISDVARAYLLWRRQWADFVLLGISPFFQQG
jgi:hypothetical protein